MGHITLCHFQQPQECSPCFGLQSRKRGAIKRKRALQSSEAFLCCSNEIAKLSQLYCLVLNDRLQCHSCQTVYHVCLCLPTCKIAQFLASWLRSRPHQTNQPRFSFRESEGLGGGKSKINLARAHVRIEQNLQESFFFSLFCFRKKGREKTFHVTGRSLVLFSYLLKGLKTLIQQNIFHRRPA